MASGVCAKAARRHWSEVARPGSGSNSEFSGALNQSDQTRLCLLDDSVHADNGDFVFVGLE